MAAHHHLHEDCRAVKPILTERLVLRWLTGDDAEFILELLNEPAFLKNIGDRQVRTKEDAASYIASGPGVSYARSGFGLYLVELAAVSVPVGICGLLKREFLDDVDIGFAFLERHWGNGFAGEAASAVMKYGCDVLGLQTIVAITAPDNRGSIHVLEKIGMRFEKMIRMPGRDGESKLFSSACDTV